MLAVASADAGVESLVARGVDGQRRLPVEARFRAISQSELARPAGLEPDAWLGRLVL
jgi:hypothetical protein